MFRKRVNPRKDRRVFSRSASRVNKKNYAGSPMRGGYAL